MSGFNKALLNYIFKSSVGKNNTILGENDSRPIESKGLLKKINQDLETTAYEKDYWLHVL